MTSHDRTDRAIRDHVEAAQQHIRAAHTLAHGGSEWAPNEPASFRVRFLLTRANWIIARLHTRWED